jgi:hypothetical protein
LPYIPVTAPPLPGEPQTTGAEIKKRRGAIMKTTRNILFALLLLSSVAGVASASTSVAAGIHIGPSGHATVDLGFFYDSLAPYGNWVERPSYGWVWAPTAVSTSWRPYENGHWVWTDEGWVWVTDEPYGWATYHYGRWYDDPEIGWAWVPGDEWGSSWVSWQAGADYVGWAPLPPGVSVSVGVGGYGGYAYGIAPENYVFVPDRYFLAPSVATYVVPTARVRGFWGQTRNFTNYRFAGGRAFNQGIPVDQVQRFVGRRVPRYQVADLGGNDFRRFRGGARIQGDRLAIFRPQVQKAARVAPPIQRAAARRAVVSAAQFKAAHPQRVAFAQRQQSLARQERQQVRQQRAEVRGGAAALNARGKALQQRQTRIDQRQAKVDRQQVRNDRVQQRQAQSLRQQQRLQRQTRVDQRQAKVDRQRVRVNQAQQRQAQSFRQQQKVQQRQTRVDQRQARVDRQRVQIDRAQQRQAQAARQQQRAAVQQQRQARAERQQFQTARQQQRAQQAQQRQAMQQQRAAQRQGQGGGRGQGGRGQAQGGNGGHRGHGNRPPGQ